MTRSTARRRGGRCQRGSATIETVIVVPAFLLFVVLIVAGGRLAHAQQTVQAAAAAGARAASLARTPVQARADATHAATAALGGDRPQCASTGVRVDTRGFAVPVGQPATVTVTVSCVVALARFDRARPAGPAHGHHDRHLTAGHVPRKSDLMTALRLPAAARLRGDERGTVTVAAVTAAAGVMLLAGLAVDGSGQVRARQAACEGAAQAARAAGQHLTDGAVRGRAAGTDPARAGAAARAHLTAAALSGTVTVTAGHVTVTATGQYQTLFLGLIGISALTASCTSTAVPVRALDGQPR